MKRLGTELAHRSADGADVTLMWSGADRVVVCVCDWRNGAYFEIRAEPHLATLRDQARFMALVGE